MLVVREARGRFASYVEHIASTLGHADRRTPFRSYCAGLILPGDRKSVEPIAARIEPRRVQGAHQSLHHFVANADWSQEDLLRRVRTFVLPAIEKSGRISAWIVDDTGFPKKGVHSVGVARQYCGQLGKQDNCQVAVSLSAANEHASLPIAFRLYLPEDWAADPVRRARPAFPRTLCSSPNRKSPSTRSAPRAPRRTGGGRAGGRRLRDRHGVRTALTRMGLTYVVGVQSSGAARPPGSGPLPPKAWSGQGRPPTLMRRDRRTSLNRPDNSPNRCRPTHGVTSHGAKASTKLCIPGSPACECGPRIATTGARSPIPKNGCSSNGRWAKAHRPNTGFRPCRPMPTLRRSLQPQKCAGGSSATIRNSSRNSASIIMKDRGWRGFHHHMALCVAAYGFLVSERS